MQCRLKKRREFLEVATKGGFCPSGTVIVQYLSLSNCVEEEGMVSQEAVDDVGVRVGFTASKRVGNAVMRNRAKRRLREAFEIISSRLQLKNCRVVLIAKTSTVTSSYDQILRDLSYALSRCKEGKFATPREPLPRGRKSAK